MKTENLLYSGKWQNLQIELIVNRNLYNKHKIAKDTYLKVEQGLLREIEQEKMKIKK